MERLQLREISFIPDTSLWAAITRWWIAHREYDVKGTIFQERNAYVMNLSAQVKHIAEIRNN